VVVLKGPSGGRESGGEYGPASPGTFGRLINRASAGNRVNSLSTGRDDLVRAETAEVANHLAAELLR